MIHKILGDKLEQVVCEIFNEKGYYVEKNKIVIGKSGEKNEFDIIAYKGKVVYIIECKNWQRKVDKKEIQLFIKKIEQCENMFSEFNIKRYLFVSYSGFTLDAYKVAKVYNLELWDYEHLVREYLDIKTGQYLRRKKITIKNSLPLKVNLVDVVKLDLINADKLAVDKIKIRFIPIWKVSYSIYKQITLPDRSKQTISGNGFIWVDALTGEILSKDNEVVKRIGNFLPKDLITIEKPSDDIELEIVDYKKEDYYDKNEIKKRIIEVLKDRYTRKFRYKTGRYYYEYDPIDGTRRRVPEIKYVKVSPSSRDIKLEFLLIKVPVIYITYKYKENEYQKVIIGHTGEVYKSDLAYCEFHLLRKVNSVAICENCGRIICGDHMYEYNNNILCEKCVPEDIKKEKYKGIKGLFKRLLSKI